MLDNAFMQFTDLSETEKAVWYAFASGSRADVQGLPDKVVRSSLIRLLLLGGGPADSGSLPALRLTGATITGDLELAYADVTAPISLHDCRINKPMDFYGSRLRQLSLYRCTMPGFTASNATIDANLRLAGARSSGEINLVGTQIGGALILDGADLTGPAVALNGTRLRVGHDVLAHDGFMCRGEIRLNNAEIGGSLRWEGANIDNPGGTALFAPDLRVGAIANLCDGFTATGNVRLPYAKVTSMVCFDGATLSGTGETALDCRHLTAAELVLLPTAPVAGVIDLSHARIGRDPMSRQRAAADRCLIFSGRALAGLR